MRKIWLFHKGKYHLCLVYANLRQIKYLWCNIFFAPCLFHGLWEEHAWSRHFTEFISEKLNALLKVIDSFLINCYFLFLDYYYSNLFWYINSGGKCVLNVCMIPQWLKNSLHFWLYRISKGYVLTNYIPDWK